MTWVLDSTRIKQTFLRPTSDDGASAPLLATGFRRFCVTAVWGFFLLALTGFDLEAAFTPAPKAAVKALRITRGKSFSAGVVFIDGRFVPPPYVVERYGNVIRINGVQATQPVVEWAEFLKTQPHAEIVRTESEPAPAPEASAPAEPPAAAGASDDPLADLFDDDAPKAVRPAAKPKPAPTPVVTTTVRLDGDFVMNGQAQDLVKKINELRTDIDAALRRGGFICFGSSYSRVSGDKAMSVAILKKLPVIMENYTDARQFAAEVRKAGFVFFPPRLVEDLFVHRMEYRKLWRRWKQLQDQAEVDAVVNNSSIMEI